MRKKFRFPVISVHFLPFSMGVGVLTGAGSGAFGGYTGLSAAAFRHWSSWGLSGGL